MTSGHQNMILHIDSVTDGLIKCLNFNLKNKSFPQVWDLATGKNMSVRSFAKKFGQKISLQQEYFFKN